MPGQFYDNALRTQHDQAAANYSGAATPMSFEGPSALNGRIEDMTLHVTTAFTVADTVVDVGENGGDVDAQLENFTIIQVGSSIGDVLAPARVDVADVDSLAAGVDIEPDVVTDVISDSGSSAGAADTRILVAWF